MKPYQIFILIVVIVFILIVGYSTYKGGLVNSIEKKVKDNKRPNFTYDQELFKGQLKSLDNSELKYMDELMDDMIKLKTSLVGTAPKQVFKSASIVEKFNSPKFEVLVSKVGTSWFNALFDTDQLKKIIVAP